LALVYHFRALGIRQTTHDVDQKLVAISLLGIANAYWSQENLSDALNYAQQALTINESFGSGNESL
jgi:tetratricopeptide (TPR) repeat protein